MGLDYYAILGVKRNCNKADIKRAYRRLAIKNNPERHNGDENLKTIFTLIAEAYEVLVDPKLRAIFDQYGEEGLKRGVPMSDEYFQPYAYHGEPVRTYQDFFGTENPYADILDYYENPLPMFDSPLGRGYKIKDDAIYRTLPLTLEEVYFGGLKKMKIQRLVFSDETCSELKLREKVLSITIKPGMMPGTAITFKEEGDQGPTKMPADIVFVTEDRPHDVYRRLTRYSYDLLTIEPITLKEALCGVTVKRTTLDGRQLTMVITDLISPTYEKVIKGEGLPISSCPKKKGKLVIRFEISYPKYIGKVGKKAFEEAFEEAEEEQIKYEKSPCGTLQI